ncbi:threonine ammonia-lyase [Poseidonocella sedimentorum]|uniref:Threonine dehydratase n=1 Tax=Poseidonocella sedimentorum TaxID=871652 RepID=A0A1I6E7R5_9RHOB|nr:threonine/serine dehydratase [Poseidonocella sedimentorum]SFR13766.1 threonine dehydratase [Poseidonocella sedimentorum]
MNIDRITAAQARIREHTRRTPLLGAPALDAIAGRRVLVKAECLQATGSFKARGSLAAITALDPAERARGVLAYSSGNHAQGIARAAQLLGIPAVIIMPRDAPAAKVEGTRSYGAEVVFYDRDGGESRETLARTIAESRGLSLIPPYEHPDVIAGQGTTGLEIAEQAAALGIDSAEVLVCCGGGGLTSGIALALEAQAPRFTVRPVEPEGFDDVKRSLATGAIQRNRGAESGLCDAVLTPQPGEMTFAIMKRLCGPGIAVSDTEVLTAMSLAFRHLKIVAEPGGAVALAAALFHKDGQSGDTVIATVSGGNVDPATFARCLADPGTPKPQRGNGI